LELLKPQFSRTRNAPRGRLFGARMALAAVAEGTDIPALFRLGDTALPRS
jgi:hypothetical protein